MKETEPETESSTAPTRRPTVPALDAMIGERISVLDHGFVSLVDYMGDDQAIVQAARVSYGRGTKRAREDRGLIRYLLRHHHTTPFEMCEIKVHVKLPIFVARQWIRHRTACLAGDSKLYFDMPNAIRKGHRSRRSMTVEKLHRLWNEGQSLTMSKKKPGYLEDIDPERIYTVPDLAKIVRRREESIRNLIRLGSLRANKRVAGPKDPKLFILGADWVCFMNTIHTNRIDLKGKLGRAYLRMCDESTGEIRHTHITDIWSTGTKPVFRVTLANGNSIKMTKDHRCLTVNGWLTLEQATSLRLNEGNSVTWRGDAPEFATNGVPPHKSKEWLAKRRSEGLDLAGIADAASMSTHTIRKQLKKFGLQFSAKERARLSGMAQRGQKRTLKVPHVYTEEWLANVRAARSGEKSNFWKGGTTDERANIGRWTREQAQRVHKRFGFSCVLCGSAKGLCAHHLDPVWNNLEQAREFSNLITICGACHRALHSKNLELQLLDETQKGEELRAFWDRHPSAAPRPIAKTRPAPRKLVRDWSKIVHIEYAGEEPTFDLSVEGPYHNFVANGFIVHNSVNEYSGRYSILDREFYVPEAGILASQSSSNRQGRGDTVSPERASQVLKLLKDDAEIAYSHYENMLGGRAATETTGEQRGEESEGIARELARINLPVSFYTQWYWKIDLHNLLRFIALRADAHAQYEIRVYAEAIASLTKLWVPDAYEAFVDYQLEAASLSRMELEAIKRMLKGETPDLAALGLSAREQADFKRRFDLG